MTDSDQQREDMQVSPEVSVQSSVVVVVGVNPSEFARHLQMLSGDCDHYMWLLP